MADRFSSMAEYYAYNLEQLRDAYGREEGMLYPVCAAILLDRERPITVDELKGLRTHIRVDEDFTGDFKGPAVVPIGCMLAASDHPEVLTIEAPKLYRELVKYLPRSSFLAMTVLAMIDFLPEEDWPAFVERCNSIYKLLVERELLDNDGEAFVAVLLAMSEKTPELATAEAMELVTRLKNLFPLRNACRAVSITLSLSGRSNDRNVRHIERLMSRLRTSGLRLTGNNSMGLLGALAFCRYDSKRFVERLREADLALAQQKGYHGVLGVSRRRRLMHSAILVAKRVSKNDTRFTIAYRAALCIILADALSAY